MSTQEALHAEVAALREALAREQRESARLRHNIEVLERMVYGPRTERRATDEPVDRLQGVLAFATLAAQGEERARTQGAAATTAPAEPERREKQGRRSTFPRHLPRIRTTFRLPEEKRACACGGRLEPLGEDVTQELERIEVTVVHEVAREKYACAACKAGVVTAAGPSRVIDKGLLGVGFLAHVLTERFQHHMPYHRQEQKHLSEGLSLSRSVLCTSALRCADLLEPVYAQLKREAFAGDFLGTDDTSVSLQEGSDGTSRRAFMWLYRDLAQRHVFDFTEGHGREGPAAMLAGFTGYLQADAAPVYDRFFAPGGPREVGCWAHARRKFVDAESSDPTLAGEALRRIRLLYDVEQRAKALEPEARRTLRQSQARPELEALFAWMGEVRGQVLDRSPMGEGLDYALKNRAALTRYLEDGRLPIDNNAVERGLRGVAVGRKNWMNVGNEEGGRRAAILYSLVETCKAIGVDPREYFRDVLLRISTCSDVAKLTPHGWKQHFQADVAAQRQAVLDRLLAGAR